MDYTIYPYEGIGPIQLGMTPEQVHEILGEPERTIERPRFNISVDDYCGLSLHVLYSSSLLCNVIEIFAPTTPSLDGVEFNLAATPYSVIKQWFQQQDTSTNIDEDGLISNKYGVSIYAPNVSQPIKKLGVFERGHFNELEDKIAKFEAEYKRRIAAGLPTDDLLRG
jgi:hypothetical protein